jgi:quercetin dioxygenase-like cupin family protein
MEGTMKKLFKVYLLFFLVACAHDGSKLDKKPTRTSILSDSWVKIDKIEIPVGAAQTLHKGKERVIVSLSDYTIEWIEDGQTKSQKSWKRGEVHWHQAKDHAAKNIGTTPARFLVVAKMTNAKNVQKVHQPHSKTGKNLPRKILENEFVTVTRVTLKPGQKQPLHSGGQRVIVALSDYEVRYKTGTAKGRQVSIKNESVHVHEAGDHSVSNVGDTNADYLIIHFK